MVSAREAGFNLRESWPLTRQDLQNQGHKVVDNRVSERSHRGKVLPLCLPRLETSLYQPKGFIR